MSSKTSPAPSYNPTFGQVILQEAIGMKSWIALLFAVICLTVLGLGVFYPKKFTAVVTIKPDRKAAVDSLLPEQDALVDAEEQLRQVRETITSPRLLQELLLGLPEESEDETEIKKRARLLADSIEVSGSAGDKIKVAYSSENPSESYNNLVSLIDLFIEDAERSQKQKVEDRYEFAKKQAENYKAQLREAELKLKEFSAKNSLDSQAEVKQRISANQKEVESLTLQIENHEARLVALGKQIAKEKKYLDVPDYSETLRAQLSDIQSRLAALRLTYTEDYPDVVDLNQKARALKQEIVKATSPDYVPKNTANSLSNLNPAYETLRKQIASEKAEVGAKQKLLNRTNSMIAEDTNLLEKIAEGQVGLVELNRDYDVLKSIYKDMLARKEKARMMLKQGGEGQGISYRVHEAARFPDGPDGLKFSQFFIAAPLLGLFVPLGLLVVYLRLDPKIRSAKNLEKITGLAVIGVVPHITTPLTKRVMRSDLILLGVFLTTVLIAYLAIAYAYQKGLF